MRATGFITGVLLAIAGCSTSAPRTLPSPALPSERPDTGLTADQARLALTGGQFRYDLRHNTTLGIEGGVDTLRSLITTTGILIVNVTDHGDSTYTVTVAADSLRLETEGLPPQAPIGSVQVGPVLQASFNRYGVTVENQLADSLCAYGQLLSTARELITPQLHMDGSLSARANARDTATTTVCRGGARITAHTIRDLTNLGEQPLQFALRGQTQLAGSGVLRNDSVIVTGSLTSQGSLLLRDGFRLPRKVETQSAGRIQVQIGDSTTVFRQTTTQLLELRQASDSLQAPPPDLYGMLSQPN